MNKEYAKTLSEDIVKILDDKKAYNIKLLHVVEQTVIADYFVLANGSSSTQIRALADEVEFKLGEKGIPLTRREGYISSDWIVLDYDCVLVHIFSREARDTFNLEKLWADAEDVDISGLLV